MTNWSVRKCTLYAKKLIWTLNIIFVQVYPCEKHLQSQKLEWKCFVHFRVKEFLYNIFLSLLFDSVPRSVIPFPHSIFNILQLLSSPLKCALVYRKFFFRWSSNYVFIVKEIRQRRALQAYVLKETTGYIQRSDLYCRKQLAVAWSSHVKRFLWSTSMKCSQSYYIDLNMPLYI